MMLWNIGLVITISLAQKWKQRISLQSTVVRNSQFVSSCLLVGSIRWVRLYIVIFPSLFSDTIQSYNPAVENTKDPKSIHRG
mmetsp:Transcript_21577/g.59984  ORF Transcript_21577/g.59984 Transcript_21577/m.59984 type:complete len:82 (+) Transcript_21577:355-600(+)